MSYNEKTKRVLGIIASISLGGVLIGVLYFFSFHVSKNNSIEQGQVSLETVSNANRPIRNGGLAIRELFSPIIKPFQVLEMSFDKVLGKNNTSSLKLNNNGTGENTEESNLSTLHLLTDEEIFDRLWPQSYHDYLHTLEDIMAQDGFIRAEEKHVTIHTNEEIYAILLKTVDFAVLKGWVVPEDAEQLRKGIKGPLADSIRVEGDALRRGGDVSEKLPLPGSQQLSSIPSEKKTIFGDVLDGLKYVFSVRQAFAGWHVFPDCYKDDNPLNSTPGFNGWAFCCDCGFVEECSPDGCVCVFELHCGTSCTCYPLGCLNAVCIAWPNAIWDQFSNPLGTGICGCG